MRKIPWGLCFLIVWALFLTASVTMYLRYFQPSKLGDTLSYGIPDELNLRSEFQFISFQFFPEPTILIQDTTIEDTKRKIKIHVEHIQAKLSWKTFFAGRPVLDSLTLIKPSLTLSLPDIAKNNAQNEKGRINNQINKLFEQGSDFSQTMHSRDDRVEDTIIYPVRMQDLLKIPLKQSQNDEVFDDEAPFEHSTLYNDAVENDDISERADAVNIESVSFSTLTLEEQEQEVRALIQRALQIKLPYIVSGTYVHIRDGQFDLLLSRNMSVENDTLKVQGIDLDLRTPHLLDGYIDLRLSHTRLHSRRVPDLDLTKTSLLLSGWDFKANSVELDLDVQTELQIGSLQKLREQPIKEAYQFFPMPTPAKFSLETKLKYEKISHNLDLFGLFRTRMILPMNKVNTPVFLDLSFSSNANTDNLEKIALNLPDETQENAPYRKAFLKDNSDLPESALKLPAFYVDKVKIDNAHLRIGRDRATISGDLLGLFPVNPLFQGKVTLHHFSLPHWIGSARKMSGGLINALDNIQGELEVIANKRGVFAPYFKGKILDVELEGLGSCGNFKAPDIALLTYPSQETTKKGTIDLNPFFPEINGVHVEKPNFPNPAVPARDLNDTSPNMFVDYHINIRTPDIKAWKVNARNVQTLITPDINETPTVQVNIAFLYGGNANAYAVLDKGNNYIKATYKNVSLETPVKNIAGFAAVKGQLSGEADVFLSGNNIGEILSSMSVKAQGELKDGSFHTENSLLQNFRHVLYRINVKSIPFDISNVKLPDYFQMKGEYDLALAYSGLQASVYTNGILDFSTKNGMPLRMGAQNSMIKYIRSGESKFDTINVNGKGLLSYDFSGKNFFQVEDFDGFLHGEKISGLFRMNLTEPLDWSGNFQFDFLDLDSYFFDKEDSKNDLKGKNKVQAQNQETSALPIDFFSENNLAFTVSAKEARLLDVTLENFTSTLALRNKELTLEKTSARVKGGGRLQAFLEAKITPNSQAKKGNILSQFKFQLEKANMLAITTMRKHETLVAGGGLMQFIGHGVFETTADLLAKLNGKYNINVRDGYIEDTSPKSNENITQNSLPIATAHENTTASSSRTSSRNSSSSKTYFNGIVASGDIIDGILHNYNFMMSSKSMIVTGGGTINLVTEELDLQAKADVGLSNVPIVVTGTISDPEIDLKMLNAFASTIGRVGTGIFSIFGSILRAPFDMITHEKVINTPPAAPPPMPELPSRVTP